MSKATFAMGCFWKPETVFRQVDGVTDARVGYAGGHVADPTYRQVCQGNTGHAEVVQVDFDSDRVSYDELLATFWANHDPTTRNRQGPDVGRQYRSAIYAHDDDQLAAARASMEARQAELSRPVVTEVEPLEVFYQAEDYHQRYLEKAGAVCY